MSESEKSGESKKYSWVEKPFKWIDGFRSESTRKIIQSVISCLIGAAIIGTITLIWANRDWITQGSKSLWNVLQYPIILKLWVPILTIITSWWTVFLAHRKKHVASLEEIKRLISEHHENAEIDSFELRINATMTMRSADKRSILITVSAVNAGKCVCFIKKVVIYINSTTQIILGTHLPPITSSPEEEDNVLNPPQSQKSVIEIKPNGGLHTWTFPLNQNPNLRVYEKNGEKYGNGHIELTTGEKARFEFLLLPSSSWEALKAPIAPTFNGKEGHRCSNCGFVFLKTIEAQAVTCPQCKHVDLKEPNLQNVREAFAASASLPKKNSDLMLEGISCDLIAPNSSGYLCRIKVHNNSPDKTANGIKVEIMEMSYEKDASRPLFPVKFPARVFPEGISGDVSINPGDNTLFTIFDAIRNTAIDGTTKQNIRFVTCRFRHPEHSQTAIFYPNKNYVIKIRVTGRDIAMIERDFRIRFLDISPEAVNRSGSETVMERFDIKFGDVCRFSLAPILSKDAEEKRLQEANRAKDDLTKFGQAILRQISAVIAVSPNSYRRDKDDETINAVLDARNYVILRLNRVAHVEFDAGIGEIHAWLIRPPGIGSTKYEDEHREVLARLKRWHQNISDIIENIDNYLK